MDASGQWLDERTFAGISDFKALIAADDQELLHNLAPQLLTYATGRDLAFSDRGALADIVTGTEKAGGGLRTLLHQIAASPLFQTRC